ncbi:hypothetical protein J5N97_008163 [Dioscorea zingiberensis]|uniref:9-cis-epoxycarotenoid dioxygenase n=1 Tax=Dioscorea zingiberensis TaxID=325984 RepID=A0A9D5HWN9_9LILI|nr:hypothetical protein J5N97_008163 [Dioscorea zingiberensis]
MVKVDIESGGVKRLEYGRKRYGGEPMFVLTMGGKEDKGYVMSLVHDEEGGVSELVVFKADELDMHECNSLGLLAAASARAGTLPFPLPHPFHASLRLPPPCQGFIMTSRNNVRLSSVTSVLVFLILLIMMQYVVLLADARIVNPDQWQSLPAKGNKHPCSDDRGVVLLESDQQVQQPEDTTPGHSPGVGHRDTTTPSFHV